ncbi:hypothetical protein [Arthrobacter bambusae]|uniref:PknH-like extracellular domain-containing protein n=1 Tax=Arthrobacter bambusae TaxID=1338426 RepID=A0AAW8DHY3_9MICC|nr:hypothetical protein [Arthrobacter bambusae]MDP9905601.1 hypothetical protein [Arthrobacter bambusae]MDQ0127317.1 hypothetical protein [Arthrobacter bambusae]MDQ0178659.1 hypothetical protein [Arthrobacter bambusae]
MIKRQQLAALVAGMTVALTGCGFSQATLASPAPTEAAASGHSSRSTISQDQLSEVLLGQQEQASLKPIGGQLSTPTSNTVGYIADVTKSYSPDAPPFCLFNRESPLDGSENKSDKSAVWSVSGGPVTLMPGNVLGGGHIDEAARAFDDNSAASSHMQLLASGISNCVGYTDINGSKVKPKPDPAGTFGPGTVSWVESYELQSKPAGSGAYPDGTKLDEQNVEFQSRNVVVRVATIGLNQADVRNLVDAARAKLDSF